MSLKQKILKRLFYILFFLILPVFVLVGQEYRPQQYTIGVIENGDTIIYRELKEVVIIPKNRTKRVERKYSNYIVKVKKVYPLAVEARELLKKYEPEYYRLQDQRDRRKLMKNLEKELLDKHKEELKRWSISDGRLLLKLINRETERTPYSLISDFRGEFSAVFWQGIAKLFKNNLKAGYDPLGDDQILEEVVILIELGYY
jgi:cell division protein YceG involved in septum cleavage